VHDGQRSHDDVASLPERERVLAVLSECGGNQSRAAKALGISRTTLVARLNEYGVPRPRKR
jgi:DNA-binding protein Fis